MFRDESKQESSEAKEGENSEEAGLRTLDGEFGAVTALPPGEVK